MRKRYDTSIEMTRGELRRKLAASFCSIALLFNILCGVVLSLGSARASVAAEPRDDGWTIACTTAGPLAVATDGRRALRAQADDPAALAPTCIFCLPLMHGDVALADAMSVSTPARQLELRQQPSSPLLAAPRLAASQTWPRGPPHLSFG